MISCTWRGFYIIIVLNFFWSCEIGSNLSSFTANEYQLLGKVDPTLVEIDSMPLHPFAIEFTEDYMVILSNEPDYLWFYSRDDFAFQFKYSEMGKGLREFLSPKQINHLEGNTFLILDYSKQSLFSFDIDGFKNGQEFIEPIFQFEDGYTPFRFYSMNNGRRFLSLGMSKKLYSVFDRTGIRIGDYVDFPNNGNVNIDPTSISLGFQGYIDVLSDGRFAYAAFKSGLMHLGQYKREHIQLIDTIQFHLATLKDASEDRGGISIKRVSSSGYEPTAFRGVAVDDDFIYSLYSGRTFSDYKEEYGECEQLFITDWKGRAVGRIELSIPMQKMKIDRKSKVLYFIGISPVNDATHIFAIKLHEILEWSK